MATRWTQTLIPTMREDPADADVPSQRLMLRAGMIRRLGAGLYSYLPLGWRALHKVMTIVREEMDAADAAELLLPTLHPIELWQRTGRDEAYGENLFTLTDRHGRKQALGPTHEEVVTDLVGSCISSYKDLPKCVYQIQTKFRDEFRPRFGVLRSREFQMKDAYSFHMRLEGEGGLDETYEKQYRAYCRIFERCGVPYRVVEAESGPIGGSASHEFMVPSPTGEDVILQSDQGDYAANVEKCAIGKREIGSAFSGAAQPPAPEPTGALEDVHTPECTTIDDVCAFFKQKLGTELAPPQMLKTMVCQAGDRWVVGVVRGDHDLNEGKLRDATGLGDLALADDRAARDAGFAIGFVGPQVAAKRDDVTLVVDPDATADTDWVTGANETDHHVRHFNWQRDVFKAGADRERIQVADIRNALEGDPAPEEKGGGTLRETRGIEVGHVFKLGDKYTRAMDVSVLDEHNKPVVPIMGCYGIGVNRILAAAIEREGGHDEAGIIWSPAVAPYQVLITPIKYDGEVREVVDRLAREIEDDGADVLIDDRTERPGVKFNDADLLGIPVRITVGDKGLKEGIVEVKARDGSTGEKGERIELDHAAKRVVELLGAL